MKRFIVLFPALWYSIIFCLPSVIEEESSTYSAVVVSNMREIRRLINLDPSSIDSIVGKFNAMCSDKTSYHSHFFTMKKGGVMEVCPMYESYYTKSFFERVLFLNWHRSENPIVRMNVNGCEDIRILKKTLTVDEKK